MLPPFNFVLTYPVRSDIMLSYESFGAGCNSLLAVQSANTGLLACADSVEFRNQRLQSGWKKRRTYIAALRRIFPHPQRLFSAFWGYFIFREDLFMQKTRINQDVKNLTAAAVFTALAFGVTALCNVFPINFIPATPWLSFDGKDVVIALCGFILGPIYALGVSLATALLELPISKTDFIGMVMNFLSSAMFSCSCALIYKATKNIKGAILGLGAAVVLTTFFMLGWNYVISPLYMKIPREQIIPLLIPAFLPFNLIKYGINAAICLLVYKPVVNALRQGGFLPKANREKFALKSTVPALCVGISALAVCIFAALYFSGKI